MLLVSIHRSSLKKIDSFPHVKISAPKTREALFERMFAFARCTHHSAKIFAQAARLVSTGKYPSVATHLVRGKKDARRVYNKRRLECTHLPTFLPRVSAAGKGRPCMAGRGGRRVGGSLSFRRSSCDSAARVTCSWSATDARLPWRGCSSY